MPDFGDDFGDGLKRVSNTILRELFHQWLRDSLRGNNMGQERVNGEDYDVMYFEDEAQRKLFEQKLQDKGIKFEEKTVPGIRYSHSDKKKVEQIYRDLIKQIDTGTYTPSAEEQGFVGSMGLGDQMSYDLQRAVFEGTLTQEEVDALGPEPTYNDLAPLFQKHPDFERTISGTWKQRLEDNAKRAEKGATDKANVSEQPAWTRKPATEKQMNALQHAEEQGLLSEEELKAAHKEGLTKGEASAILDQHKDRYGELNLDEKAKSDLAQAEQKAQEARGQGGKETAAEETLADAEIEEKATEEQSAPEAEQPLEEAVGNGKDERHDAKALEEKHPEVAQKLRDAGYDMNDLTKNDARMVPSHDGMDPDHHTEAAVAEIPSPIPADWDLSGISWNGIVLPKIGKVRARIHRIPEGKFVSCTVERKASGAYYASINVKERELPAYPAATGEVGITFGASHWAVTSDGQVMDLPERIERLQRRLAIAQRDLARKEPGSQNYLRQKRKVARINERIADVRKAATHNATRELVNGYGTIAARQMNSKDMQQHGSAATKDLPRKVKKMLNRKMLDGNFAEFNRQLAYKSAWANRSFVEVPGDTPTAQVCSRCGHEELVLARDLRPAWTCPECGAKHDRKANGAQNVLEAGKDILAKQERSFVTKAKKSRTKKRAK